MPLLHEANDSIHGDEKGDKGHETLSKSRPAFDVVAMHLRPEDA